MECEKRKGIKLKAVFEGVGWSRRFIRYDCPKDCPGCEKEKEANGNRAVFSNGDGWGRH